MVDTTVIHYGGPISCGHFIKNHVLHSLM